ncbi:MAG: helicase-related protein [Gemmataceae bacterium]
MPNRTSKTGSELFIVDNSDTDWKVRRYLHDWCDYSKSLDVATAYFEIGSLLALDGEWQKVDAIRILMGDEISLRTKAAFDLSLANITRRLDSSLEQEKEKNDFLAGVPAVVDALRTGKIRCRVYRKAKFHAKAYINHARKEVLGSAALVGSSNFTFPGLTENIELNVQITGGPVTVLQEWYEQHWNEAEDVSPEILRVIERHVREYTPFEVYAKALQEYFKGHEMSAGEWELAGPEKGGSHMYRILDQYQKEGYQNLMKIVRQHNGAFLCDGVGLGKTFIGLMLIERLIVQERKRVALIVPKVGREPVWERAIRRYLPHIGSLDYSNLALFNHTDLQRGGDFPARLKRIREMADAIVIDEAHHFRNPGVRAGGGGIQSETARPSRYWKLDDLIEGPRGVKQLFLLTATPINNRLIDFQHMAELFTRRQPDYFKNSLGIHSLPGHFRKMEKDLEKAVAPSGNGAASVETNLAEAEQVLSGDALFQNLVVQRSRAYVRQSQLQHGGTQALFPTRDDPKVAEYFLKKTYGRLLKMVEDAFAKEKPLFSLAMYYPLAYYHGPDQTIDPFVENRQRQVVGLIRTQFLKRFESSAHAFECSCHRLLLKLLAFATKHSEEPDEKKSLEKWRLRHKDLTKHVQERYLANLYGESEEEADEDLITEEMLEAVPDLPREQYDVPRILQETRDDLEEIADFLEELAKFQPSHDDKLKALVKLLKTDPVLSKHKVLIFTEFADTARYLEEQLAALGIAGIAEIDSASGRDKAEVIRQFAPYYNDSSSGELASDGSPETSILVSTDVLSEGLNLQDATRMINYDLHWNPVRLMQRIGRVDRRLNPEVEARLVADHPEQAKLRGKVAYWNFLPPEELNELLTLYRRVTHKTLRISKTFGIEGKKLLTPEDDYEAVREFNHAYEGITTPVEALHLEYQQFLKDHPGLADKLANLPGKLFSGKAHPTPGIRAVFFCYALPAADRAAPALANGGQLPWTLEAGHTAWYLFDLASEQIIQDADQIASFTRSRPETPRHCTLDRKTLGGLRATLEKHIKNTYLKSVQAPVGVKPVLTAWMELT